MTRLLALALLLLAMPAQADVTVAFSPGDAELTVVAAIASAERSVHLAAYSFTSRPVAQALVDSKARGVEIEAVLDRRTPRAAIPGRRSWPAPASRCGSTPDTPSCTTSSW